MFPLPLGEMRDLVGDDVLLVYDASHTIGLIAGGCYQSPLEEGCNVLQGNSHKTFPGPQKGMIHYRDVELGKLACKAISAGLISNQHAHHAIAEYITVFEMKEFGQEYAQQCLKNAQSLAEALTNAGITLYQHRGQFTSSHVLLLLFPTPDGHTSACRKLHHAAIITNSRIALQRGVIRIGVQEVTRRGMKSRDMCQIAEFIKRVIVDGEPTIRVREDVVAFNRLFTRIAYSFDSSFDLD